MIYKALTYNNGPLDVPVEPFGPLGVQPEIIDTKGSPKLSKVHYVVVHLLTGHVVCHDLWTLDQARELARELSGIRGWNSIPKEYRAGYPGSVRLLQSAVGPQFLERVKLVIARHRHWKESRP